MSVCVCVCVWSAALTLPPDGQNLIFCSASSTAKSFFYSSTNRDRRAAFCFFFKLFFTGLTLHPWMISFLNFEGTWCTSFWKSQKFRLRLDRSGRRHCVIRNVGNILPNETASCPQPQFWKTPTSISLFYLYILYILFLYIYYSSSRNNKIINKEKNCDKRKHYWRGDIF